MRWYATNLNVQDARKLRKHVAKITKPRIPYMELLEMAATERSKTTNSEKHRNEKIIIDCFAITIHNIENDKNVSSVMFEFYILYENINDKTASVV
jgi:hypothetical protein